jgi:methylation protein EvaC
MLYDFGVVPLAGYFPLPGEEQEKNRAEMALKGCKKCNLIQIDPIVDDSYLFSEYRYRSSFSMRRHFQELARWIKMKKVSSKSRILEIGSNDGTLLQELISLGLNPIGVDPAKNIISHSRELGHEVIEGHFSTDFVHRNNLVGKFDIVISCNSFAHIENIQDIAHAISLTLVDNGIFIVEVQSWEELVRRRTFDFVYHEHKYYYDLNSIDNLMSKNGFELLEKEKIEIHGGSWRLLFAKTKGSKLISRNLSHKKEIKTEEFQTAIIDFWANLELVRHQIKQIKDDGGTIIGFGASGRANMLMAYLDIGEKISWIVDESSERVGRNMGFTGIEIRAFGDLRAEEYSHCLVLAWNFFDLIREKWPHKNKVLLRPLPTFEMITT